MIEAVVCTLELHACFSMNETTFNHLQRILCFHETLREKHGIGLIINDESVCTLDILRVGIG